MRRICYRLDSSTEVLRRPNTGSSLHPDTRLTRTRVENARGVELLTSEVDKIRLLMPELGMSCILPMKEVQRTSLSLNRLLRQSMAAEITEGSGKKVLCKVVATVCCASRPAVL
jgi:hypothetical protein